MGTITKNFSYREFEASEMAKQLGLMNIITTFEIRDAVKELTEKVLQPLRDAYGKPLKINSGYRCPELNRLVNGAKASQHMKGEAADVHTGSEKESVKLARLAVKLKLPFDQMILYPTFVHFSHKCGGFQRGQVLYNRSYHGEQV